MLETLDKLMLAGIGAMNMTKEKAEQIFDEYVRRGQTQMNNRTVFVRDLMDSVEATRRDMREFVAGQVRETISRLNLASRDDVARLEAKLDQLLKETGHEAHKSKKG